MTFGEYILEVMGEWAERPWRAGQTYYNVLANVRPDLADAVRGTARDPFHNDGVIGDFLDYVMRHW